MSLKLKAVPFGEAKPIEGCSCTFCKRGREREEELAELEAEASDFLTWAVVLGLVVLAAVGTLATLYLVGQASKAAGVHMVGRATISNVAKP